MIGLMGRSSFFRSLIVFASAAVSAAASAQTQGAIYDTEITGLNVNQNQYDHCYDVYLNGGPQNANAQGLTPGDYYFQVTSPDGQTLLSADHVRNRRVVVTLDGTGDGRINGPIPDPTLPAVYPGHFSPSNGGLIYTTDINGDPFTWNPDHNTEAFVNTENGSRGVHLWPFHETPNNGGVYKIWLVPVEEYDAANAANPSENFGFKSGQTKTDTFKCAHDAGDETPPLAILSGSKFYDIDHDGTRDIPEDYGIPGWEIHIVGILGGEVFDETILTDADGNWTVELDAGTDFEICENIPTADPAWTQSHPTPGETVGPATADADRCWTGTIGDSGDPGDNDIPGLDFGNYRAAEFSGHKFYDANNNGLDDDGEVVAGIRINVYVDNGEGEVLYDPDGLGYTTVTDANGDWSVSINLFDSENYTFRIEEVIPGTGDPDCQWYQTFPETGDYTVTTSTDDLDFGNVCICFPSEGRTLGFWSNKNGKALLQATGETWRTMLNALNLRNPDGTNFDIADASFATEYSTFRAWLLNGNAVNMAYMTSVQLAASELNVMIMGLGDTDELFLPDHLADCWGEPTAQLGEVQTAANNMLGADGDVPAGDEPTRTEMACLKDILDASNNNELYYLHDGQCDVVYP